MVTRRASLRPKLHLASCSMDGPSAQGAFLPGLDLMLRADAKDAARLAAQRICEEYVTGYTPR